MTDGGSTNGEPAFRSGASAAGPALPRARSEAGGGGSLARRRGAFPAGSSGRGAGAGSAEPERPLLPGGARPCCRRAGSAAAGGGPGGSGRPGAAAAGWDRNDPVAPSLPPPHRARPAPRHPRTPRLSPFSSGPGWVSAPTLVLLSPGSSCSWFGVGGGGACLHLSGLGSAAAEGWVGSGRARTTLRGRREARDAENGAGSAPHRDPGLAAVSARRLFLIIVRLGRRRSRGAAASARTAPGGGGGCGAGLPARSPQGGPGAREGTGDSGLSTRAAGLEVSSEGVGRTGVRAALCSGGVKAEMLKMELPGSETRLARKARGREGAPHLRRGSGFRWGCTAPGACGHLSPGSAEPAPGEAASLSPVRAGNSRT